MLPDDLIDAKEGARLIGVHVSTLLRWALSGQIKAYKVGGRYRFSRRDVLAKVQVVGGEATGHAQAVSELRTAGLMK